MAFASFERAGTRAPVAEINMVPLIDVMLVLLVVFMVTAPLLTHAVKLELPRASAQPERAPPQKIELSIDAAGALYWDGQPLAREAAIERFAAAARREPPPALQLRADAEVPYRVVARTLADASRAGLSRIGFVSLPEAAAD